MKKFLIFLVATIVTVCIGMVFYQFAKNDEVIKVETTTVYVNYGEKLSLDDIGFSRIDASKDTKINFNAGGDEVTSIIKYDEDSKCYIPTQKGGSTTIKISTSLRKYKTFTIDVIVGVGTEECPYYISNEQQLADIGTKYSLDACFELVKDINLTKAHTPIGLLENGYQEFTGTFNGKYHTISNLKIGNCDNAGLFAILGSTSSVSNLNIDNALIEGSFLNAGALAGICYGNINKVIISNASITNSRTSSNTGAVVGLLQTDAVNNSSIAGILRTSAYTDKNKVISANGTLGGLVGTVDSAIIHACYTNIDLKNNSIKPTGGLVGQFIVNKDAYIRESYSVSTIQAKTGYTGNVIGQITLSNNTKLSNINKTMVLVGIYYNNSLNNLSGVGSDINGFATASTFAVNGKSTAEMKQKITYVYYINTDNNAVYWDKVWNLVDGEYPKLTFVSKFDEIVMEDPNGSTTTPDITDPEQNNPNAIAISSKQDLVKYFQQGTAVTGDYVITSHIDLDGMTWIPVDFSGTLKSSKSIYSISNFKINSSKLHIGFFSSLSSATITNVEFAKIKIAKNGSNETVGSVVGYIRGNTTINNIFVTDSEIGATAKYAGGIAGYSSSISAIKNATVTKLDFTGNSSNVGGIAGYASTDTSIINSNIKGVNKIMGVNRVGGISAVNYSNNIKNCNFAGTIKSNSTASSAGYFGGLSGVNYGTFTNCVTSGDIIATNSSTANGSIYYFVGGLCGYNLGKFTLCSSYGNSTSAGSSTNTVYLGGLTGYNKGVLKACYSHKSNIGEVKTTNITAGLSAYNYGGKIEGCIVFSKLNGYIVSGLVYANGNNGIIDSCLTGKDTTERTTYKGIIVTAFAYDINSGKIENCSVNAVLNSTSDKGWVAGFAGFMPYSGKNKFGTISHCISNVSFTGVGSKYLEIAQDGLMNKTRTTGTITKCVINKDADCEGVIKSKYSKFMGITYDPASGSNFIIADTATMQKIETYLDIDTCNFDIASGDGDSKWVYYNSRIPMPREVTKIFANAGDSNFDENSKEFEGVEG